MPRGCNQLQKSISLTRLVNDLIYYIHERIPNFDFSPLAKKLFIKFIPVSTRDHYKAVEINLYSLKSS